MASFDSKPNPPPSLYAHVKIEKEKASFVLLILEILEIKIVKKKKKIYKDPENSSFFHYVFTFNQAYHLPPHIEVHRIFNMYMYLLSISQYCPVLA